MLHFIIVAGLTILVLVCVVILFSIRSDDPPPKLPRDIARRAIDDRTHFYEAVNPNRGLPPVPPSRRPRHAADEAQTDVVYYGKVGGQPTTRILPSMGNRH